MHELLVSRGFVRRPKALNSSDEDGGVAEQTSQAERRETDAATAERKLKSAQASGPHVSVTIERYIFPRNRAIRDRLCLVLVLLSGTIL